MSLRPYQAELIEGIKAEHAAGSRNVLAVMPTGAGKTVTFSHMIRDAACPVAVQVHRTELVCQISVALARCGVHHRIIAPAQTISTVTAEHRRELGESFYVPHAPHSVVAVDTLIARGDRYEHYCQQVGLWITDEAAHVQGNPPNKWGVCAGMFPNAYGVGFTATPKRADGRGLGADNHGLFHSMIEGPSTAWLIANGYLSKYRIISQPSDMNIEDLKATAGGDYNSKVLATRAHESHIVGDVVSHYKRYADGKQGITFATDVETAQHLADQFNAENVPAACVSAKTPDGERAATIRAFREGRLRQLTNCDLFGEGFDVPGVEVVSLARPTMSLSLYLQQVGRGLRTAEGKEYAVIIDHVGNWKRHGLPDTPRKWSLEPRQAGEKRERDTDVVATTSCLGCFQVFLRVHMPTCPLCGHYHEPQARRRPEQVDGDLTELDLDALRELRESVQLADPDDVARKAFYAGAGTAGAAGAREKQQAKIEAQAALRDAIALWAGHGKARGITDSEMYRTFYLRFGVDVVSAQLGTRREMEDLKVRIENEPL